MSRVAREVSRLHTSLWLVGFFAFTAGMIATQPYAQAVSEGFAVFGLASGVMAIGSFTHHSVTYCEWAKRLPGVADGSGDPPSETEVS